MRAQLFIAAVSLQSFPLWSQEIVYSDALKAHYPVEGKAFDLGSYEREVPVVVWNAGDDRSATVTRTKGDAYPYEQQKGLITVEGGGLAMPLVLSARHFRTVDVTWISEKLIQIRIGVSRIAVVEAIYDVLEREWVYLESLHYSE